MLFDPCVLALCFVLVAIRIWHLSAFGSFAEFFSMRVKVLNIVVALSLFYFWHLTFLSLGLYRSKRIGNQAQEVADLLLSTFVATAMLGIVAALFRVRMVNLEFVVMFWAISSAVLILSRVTMRYLLARIRSRGHNLRHLLIVGTNSRALKFADSIHARPELGYQLIGFADEPWTERPKLENESIVTDLGHFSDFLRERVVDEVVIALPMKSFYSQSAQIVSQCQEQGIIVRTLTSMFDHPAGRVQLGELDATHLATYNAKHFEGWPLVFKRLLDFLSSATLLLLLSPILLAAAVLIKLDSPGPVFFVQERVGLNKRKFRIFKFRTMGVNAEAEQSDLEMLNEADGPVFKIKRDPRITRIGRYLRKSSIDELPQLLNVLKGDMSLVGPRPLPIRDYQGFDQDWVRRRFSVRPGITCLWQINGRSSVSFHEWMKLDLHYIDHWSLWLDLKVIVKTIPAVLKGVGAA